MKTILLYLLIIFLITGCKNQSSNSNDKNLYNESTIFTPDDYSNLFKSEKANEYYVNGSEHFYEKNFEEAIYNYSHSIDIEPTAAAYNELGVVYYTKNDFKNAVNAFQNSIEIDSTFWSSHFNLAKLYGKAENYDESIKILENVISKTDSKFWKDYSMLALAVIYYNINELSKADDMIKKSSDLKSHPEIKHIYLKTQSRINKNK